MTPFYITNSNFPVSSLACDIEKILRRLKDERKAGKVLRKNRLDDVCSHIKVTQNQN